MSEITAQRLQEIKVEPCPFCGSDDTDASFALTGEGKYCAGCMDCGACGSEKPTPEEAVESWNTLSIRYYLTALAVKETESLQSQLAAERARVKELEAEREWVSVEERLPELEVEVLLSDGKESTLGYLANPDKLYDISINIDWYGYVKEKPFREVTHWKPLPAPSEAK